MDPNNITFLNDITWRMTKYTIKVRVLRLWKRENRKKPGEILSLDMVLMDEQVMFLTYYFFNLFFSTHLFVAKIGC